jgi:hypothetical protein
MTHYEAPTPELEKLHDELGYYPKPDDFEPVKDFPRDHKWFGRPRCQGWNWYMGRQCMGLAMVSVGVDKCKNCGGKSLRGSASPSFKHGRYSKFLPERLVQKYMQISSDTEIMDMRTRVELLETRIVEIVDHLDEQGSFEIFKELKKSFEMYEHYVQLSRSASPDRQKEYSQRAAENLNKVSILIRKGMDDGNMWREISDLTESIRKLADTEQRQIKTMESAVMVDRVMVFATAMASIVRDTIMSISELPVNSKKKILSNFEIQVTQLLKQGEYAKTDVIDGEYTDTTP